MNLKITLQLLCVILLLAGSLRAENIDPYGDDSQYAYGENVGWLNFQPSTGDGVQVSSTELTGYVWAENIGWINLSPASYGGVVNDGTGNLSGYAWGENVGWINFDPANGGVTIDADGYFDGWAWGENIGWIQFDSAESWSVVACVVTLQDLQNFASYWLSSAAEADLSPNETVNLPDFAVFAEYWQTFCPDGWQLK
jgi:hypothetical protein